jgi:hypothetical protein
MLSKMQTQLKISNMKRIFGSIAIVSLALTGCLKDKPNNDFTSISAVLEMPYQGLEYFGSDGIVTAGKTSPIVIPFTVNLASVNTMSSDITYTVGVDDSKRTAYNANAANPIVDYVALPAALYTISRTSGTIKAGKRLDTLYLTIGDPTQVDPSKDFMIPITLKTASNGITISGNFATAYFHIIGNPLAGKYTWNYRRFQSADTTASPLQNITQTTVCLPVTPTQLMTPETYTQTFISPNDGIVLQFSNNAGTLSNFQTILDATTLAGIPAGGFTLLDGPKLASPVQIVGTVATNFIGTHFRTYIQYLNSSGGTRSLVNDFIKIP